MITAAETCDFVNQVVCKPANVKELFEFTNFSGTQISRTEVLILLAAIIPVLVVFFGLRKKSIVPGKLQSAVESIFSFVKDVQISSVWGPDILIIAIPLGPFPEDNAKIFI